MVGMAGGRRVGARWAALQYGGLTNSGGAIYPPNASDPTLNRVKANASGCDAAALAAPCFDIGNTFAASQSATMVSSSATITVTGGISANARPFVVGQLLSCTSCMTGRFITAVSLPPTQDTRTGQGQVGQTFTITASGTMGVSATETLTAGCSGVSGTGSNCIDVAIQQNTTNGIYGTAWALATCGENDLNGTAPNYTVPGGVCHNNGIGSLTHSFRIGTLQKMWSLTAGSAFNQSAAFTCNIVSANVVQCVKGAAYTSGLVTGIGEWLSGTTFIEYGDPTVGIGRIATLMGSNGGQPLTFTAGSGYTNGTQTIALVCTSLASGAVKPKVDVTVSGGAIVNVYGSTANNAMGLGIGGGCTVPLTAIGAGTGGSVTITLAPSDGQPGIATLGTDNNMLGDLLYDNSGLVGNPLNPFFTNGFGGYFEPGLPVQPWGNYLGAAVSG
jgi:hypothetical protein